MKLSLPVLVLHLVSGGLACGADLSGSTSPTAQFDINFFPPVSFTYSDSPFPGQASSASVANTTINNALTLAISEALKSNSIFLASPPTVTYFYTPQQVNIAEGEQCTVAGTYIASGGTILYQCEAGKLTTIPADTTTELLTTETPADSTPKEFVVEEKEDTNEFGNIDFNQIRKKRQVQSELFQQYMKVSTTSPQTLYESQWKKIAASVQSSLEARKVIFSDEITVTLIGQ